MDDLTDSQLIAICLVALAGLISIVLVARWGHLNEGYPGRTCKCGTKKVNKGSHFACPKCDFDPDPRP